MKGNPLKSKDYDTTLCELNMCIYSMFPVASGKMWLSQLCQKLFLSTTHVLEYDLIFADLYKVICRNVWWAEGDGKHVAKGRGGQVGEDVDWWGRLTNRIQSRETRNIFQESFISMIFCLQYTVI